MICFFKGFVTLLTCWRIFQLSPLCFHQFCSKDAGLGWAPRTGHTHTRRGRRMLYDLIIFDPLPYTKIYNMRSYEMLKWWVSNVFFKLKAGETWARWRYCSLCPGRLDSPKKRRWQKMRFSNKSLSWQVLYLAYSSSGIGSAAFLHTPILENITGFSGYNF